MTGNVKALSMGLYSKHKGGCVKIHVFTSTAVKKGALKNHIIDKNVVKCVAIVRSTPNFINFFIFLTIIYYFLIVLDILRQAFKNNP